MNVSADAYTGGDELLSMLAEIERDLWTRGGVDGHRRRCEAITAAIVAGCSVTSVADVLGVSRDDVAAWLTRH